MESRAQGGWGAGRVLGHMAMVATGGEMASGPWGPPGGLRP